MRCLYSMFSVGWVVTLASFQALIRFKTAFLRTPKAAGKTGPFNSLFVTQWEAGIGAAMPGARSSHPGMG